MANNPVMEAHHEEKKTFSYAYAGLTFNVTLRTDIKEELKSMVVILDRAKEEIENEITTRFPKA